MIVAESPGRGVSVFQKRSTLPSGSATRGPGRVFSLIAGDAQYLARVTHATSRLRPIFGLK